MAEVFKIWGTFTLKEDGDISKRLSNIEASAEDAAKGVGKATESLNDFNTGAAETNKAANDSEGAIESLQGAFDDFGGAAGGAAAVIAGVFITALIDAAQYTDDFERNLDDVVRRTEANTKETEGYKKSLENLFKEGFSNDINQIGEAHNAAAVQTNLHGQQLEDVTKKTIYLAERLGTDYGETIKVIDGMVKNYGITHEEAFNIIAKGYDENLNVGGDLLDLYSEYGPVLQQIGIDENDMLAIMVSAREKGIFSYDQLLDGAKEFQIKVFEMLQDEEAAKEFFDSIGLKASDVKKAFEEGGDSATKMSGRIMLALSEIEDPIERSKIGVALYGTKWEDTGGKINDVMLNSKYRTVETTNAMDNLIKTDTEPLAKEWNSFYNTWKADTMEPFGKALNKGAEAVLNFVNKSNDYVKSGFNSLMKKVDETTNFIEKAFNSMVSWSKNKLNEFAKNMWNAAQKAGDWFFDVIDSFVDDMISDLNKLGSFVDGVTSAFKSMGGAVSGVINKISNIKFPSKPSWLPSFATGVKDFAGGMAMVGEEGPELVYLPPGSNVYTNKETRNMLENAAARDINNFSTISTTTGSTYNINMRVDADSITSVQKLINLFEEIETQSLVQNV